MSAEIQKLYIAYFNRPADPGGLAYWTAQLASGVSMTQIANSFSASAEYQAIYVGKTNLVLIDQLYQNLFGRPSDAGGLLYWAGEMAAGRVTITSLASTLSSGTTPGSADNIAINSKISAATAFTAAIDTAPEIIAYSGTGAMARASTWLSTVTNAATLATAIAPAALTTVVAETVTAGAAAGQTFTLTTSLNTFTGGTGDDTFDAGVVNTLSTGDVLSGGLGTDTLTAVLNNTTTTVNSSSIEKFNLTATGAATLNMASASGVTAIANLGSANTLTLNNLASIPTVNINSNASTTTLNFGNAAMAGTNDLSINLEGAAAATVTLTSASGSTNTLETVSVSSTSVSNSLTLNTTGVGATKLNITGVQALTVTNTLDTEITTVSGGTATGAISIAVGNITGASVTTGTAADTITAGAGNDNLSGNAGNDTFKFGATNLTLVDTVAGGDGTDIISFTAAATVGDAAFTLVTSVATLTSDASIDVDYTLGTLAMAAGVATVTFAGDDADTDSLIVQAGFTSNLTVNLDADTTEGNTINATAYTGVLTVASNLLNLNNATDLQTIAGGTGSDVLAVTLTTTAIGVAQTSITNIEKITVVDGLSTTIATGTIALADENAVGTSTVKSTITVDASALTADSIIINAALEDDAQVFILGGGAIDTITASLSANWGDSISAGGGNDVLHFNGTNLTAADTVAGGDGVDTISFNAAATVGDASFTLVTSVATLTSAASIDVDYTLGALAMAAGVATVTFAGDAADTDSLIVQAGFTSNLTVNLDADTTEGNTINATAYTGVLTVASDLLNLNNATDLQTITGGTGSDVLAISLSANATGVAQTSITKVEKFTVTDGDTAVVAAGTVVLANANATFSSVVTYETITVDASALTTDTLTIDAVLEVDAKVIILGGGAIDTIIASASANFGDSISAGGGADTIRFGATSLTSADTVAGGDGVDIIDFSADATVGDSAFTNVTSVATLKGSGATEGVSLTLAALASAAGITTVTFTDEGAATDSVTVGSTFTNALTVNLDTAATAINTVIATGYTGTLVVAATDTLFTTGANAITGGSGNDSLSITAAGATIEAADLASVTKVEAFNVVGTTAATTIILSNNNAAYTSSTVYDTLTVNASALTTGVATINASAEVDGKVIVMGGGGDDVITATASANFGDNLTGGNGSDSFTITSAGFTSADTIGGGDGDDTITLSDAATVVDADFTNVTSVKTLTSGNNNNTTTLGALASAAGLTAITGGTGTNVFTVGSGYTGALTIALVAGTDKIDATGNTPGVTVTIAETSLTTNDTLIGGSGTDTINLTGDAGAGNYTSISKFEVIKTVGDTAVSITTVDGNVDEGKTLTINATSLTSTALTFDGSAENSASAAGSFIITATGTAAHGITLGSGNDSYISTSTGVDSVVATAGNNTISTGLGADSITGGTGNDNIDAGAGDDIFLFATLNLTSADTVAGGDGADLLKLSNDALVIDSDFTKFTSVETITGGGIGIQLDVTLGALAAAAGVTTVTFVNTADAQTDTLTVGAGFTGATLTVNLDGDATAGTTNAVIATGYTGALTVAALQGSLDTLVHTLTGGSGSDTLQLTSVTGGITLAATATAQISAIETFKTVGNDALNITLSEGNVLTGGTLTMNATSMTSGKLTFSGGTQTAGGAVSVITLGSGAHDITLAAGADTYVGTGSGATTLSGGAGADSITTGSGADSVVGGDGNDTLIGGSGADSITGGAGADSLMGGADADTFIYTEVAQSGGSNLDTITDFATASDKLRFTLDYTGQTVGFVVNATIVSAAAGLTNAQAALTAERGQYIYDTTNSRLYVNVNNDNMITALDYTVGLNAATVVADSILTGDVNFVITGGSGADTITAGGGADTIDGAVGDDVIVGGDGADSISGGAGADTITGGAGADTIDTGAGINLVIAGSGFDTIDLTTSTDATTIRTAALVVANNFNALNFLVAADKVEYTGAVLNGTGVVVGGAEDTTARATLSLIAANKTSVQLTTDIANDLIDGYLAGTTTLDAFKTAIITAAGTTTDAALAAGTAVLVFMNDNEDTVILRVQNTTATTDALTATEIEIVGIIQGDMLDATEMATVLI
jgi:Ca2+-binding RTX toxin-like protein